MSHIFISYSHKDNKYVEKLEKKLIEAGFNIWIDHRIDYCAQWPKEIQKQLDTCDAFIVVVTENAFESEWVQHEVAMAKRKKKPFFPLLLQGDPWLSVEATQYVSVSDYSLPPEKFYKRLEGVTLREKTKRDSVEKAKREDAEKAAREKAEREAAKKAVREKAEREAKEKEKRKKKERPSEPKKETNPLVWITGFVVFIVFFAIVTNSASNSSPSITVPATATRTYTSYPVTATLTSTNTSTPVATKIPTQTPLPTNTNTPIVISSPTKVYQIGDTWTRPTDDMAMSYVPAGEFQMGSEDNYWGNQPVHIVYLDAFWIDQTEVTNAMYSQCVESSMCEQPNPTSFIATRYYSSSYSEPVKHDNYFGAVEFSNFPVVNVSWEDAKTYCEWVKGRLPTEAEWEKAARGTDGRVYPWGDIVHCDKAKFDCLDTDIVTDVYHMPRLDIRAVGRYTSRSPYGLFDMAGNAAEWVVDWYDENYYAVSPLSNPIGPDIGSERVVRGGDYASFDRSRTFARKAEKPG